MIMRFLLLLFLASATGVSAQNKADSLWGLYREHKNEAVVIALSYELATMEKDKASKYINDMIRWGQEHKDPVPEAVAYNSLGGFYYKQGDYSLAEYNFRASLKIRDSMGDKKATASLYNNLGSVYQSQGDYAKSLENHLASLRLKEALKDEKGMGVSYNNIANVYRKIGQLDKALEYHRLSLAIKEKQKDPQAISTALFNIANTCFELKQFDKAQRYFEKALALQLRINDDYLLGNTYNSLGFLCKTRKQYDQAMEHFRKAMTHHGKSGNKTGIATLYNNMGSVYLDQGKLGPAEENYEQGLAIARSIGDKEIIQEATRNLADIHAKNKDYLKALSLMEDAGKVKDSIFSIEGQRAIAEMQTKYETEKKEASITLLQKENELQEVRNRNTLLFAAAVIILILAGGLFLYSYLRILQKKRLSDERAMMEKARLNAVIQTQEEERRRISAELHDGVGPVLSAVKLNLSMLGVDSGDALRYGTAMELIDRSYNELRAISHAMMPSVLLDKGLAAATEQLINGIASAGTMNIYFYTEDSKRRYSELIEIHLYRIIQELLNNIIRHSKATEVQIQMLTDDRELQIMIEDNGDGFDIALLKNSSGNGWSNINSRLNIIDGSVEMDSREGKKGTVVFIAVPLEAAFM